MPDPRFSKRFPLLQKEPAKIIKPASLFVPAVQPLQANFSSHFSSGDAPFEALFFDQSIGKPTEWFWDFGDGTTSTQQNPRHTYAVAGIYAVSLTASNATGSDRVTKPRLISSTMVADFEATPVSGEAPLDVTFTDLTTGTPSFWAWDFGDTATSTDQHPVHTYQTAGAYDASLTAGNIGASASLTKTAYIQVSSPSMDDGWPENDTFPVDFYSVGNRWVVCFDEKYSGSAAMKPVSNAGLTRALVLNKNRSNKYIFDNNKKVTVYFYYKTDGSIDFKCGPYFDFNIYRSVEASSSWRKARMNLTFINDGSAVLGFIFVLYIGSSGMVWLDSFQMEEHDWTGEQENILLYD